MTHIEDIHVLDIMHNTVMLLHYLITVRVYPTVKYYHLIRIEDIYCLSDYIMI